jgi:DNA repair exonuclease SbcCD nuclease subunit
MHIAHLADVHLGHRQYGLLQREDDMANTFRSALGQLVESNPELVLLPGDLFHSRDLRPKVLDDAERALADVPDDIPVLVSRGNHDENLTPRSVTWLNYLHRRDHIVLLEADLDDDTAGFEQYDPVEPGSKSGFYDHETDHGVVRVFGLQWRGARTDQALEQVARGIRATNNEHGEPAYTVLLAHFGIEDEVPALGGNVTHAELREVKEVVDYLALGHIHKRYDASEWIYNPGSPEAHSTTEVQDDWDHGYYTVTLDEAEGTAGSAGPGDLEHDVTHHLTKRRPFFTTEFDVTSYDSPGDLETAFNDHLEGERTTLNTEISHERFQASGNRREPMVDLRFTGTLPFDRADLPVDRLAERTEDVFDALYVQTNTSGVTSADIQALLEDLDDEEVFIDGRLQTEVLEQRVFRTIAAESQYSDHADEVASLLSTAHRMAQAEETAEDIRDTVSERRQELFPDLTDDVVIDVAEDPFAEQATTDETEGSAETDEPDVAAESAAGTTGGDDE